MFARLCPLLASLSLCMVCTLRADETVDGLEFFEEKIRPVLVQHCYKCHSADAKEVKGNLLLDTREGVLRGGDSGHAVVPGNLDESVLIEALKYETFEMPPDRPLPENVIRDFEKWVTLGAPDPREGSTPLLKREIDFEAAREFWSFRPVTQPAVPAVKRADWPASDVDRFVMAKLEASRLTPVGDADPQALIRRVYFDLIGLPPTPEEVAAFLADPSEDAYAALVDRLLDSPRFGERWGRHWLDVVRYGESTGMDRDFTFPHAWRYRDYVIAAFNGDKPFDQFLREQIAGDLLGAAAADATADHWIATGMLSLGAKSMNEPNAEQFRMDVVDDQIDVVTRAFLGLTASCARCHDHKFDPIPQSEYYGLAGIFTSTQTCYGTVRQGGNRQPGSLIAWSETSLSTVSLGADPRDKDTSPEDLKKQLANLKRKLESLRNQPAAEAKTARAASRIEQQIKELQGQLARTAQEQAPADAMLVMGVLEGDRPGDTELRIRGEPNDRGARIPRSFLTIATGDTPPAVPSGQSGRLQLADWLLDEGNPLTARVAVNRIWQHLFGRGIVASVNNFGATGDPPTHPELLDHLALRLSREHGWSFKQMIRELVHTRTYRLGVDEDPQALAIDPDNKLLWRMNQRRLEVEAIRDAMLAVSGRLDVTPMEGSVVATIGDGDVGTNLRNRDFHAESFKRSVYLPVVRSALPEMLRLFDFPEPSIIADQRDVTTVPTQALFLMNSPFVLARAEEFAGDLLSDESLDDAARIDLAYQRALSRQPSAGEIELAYEFIKTISPRDDVPPKEQRLRGWTGFCQALLVSAEFRYLN